MCLSPSKRDRTKDAAHYDYEIGDIIMNRYKIIKHLGDGTFGRVFEVVSLKSGEIYACKIIRAVSRYIKSAKIEARILENIKNKVQGTVRVRNHFEFQKSSQFRGQYCILFERLGRSLFQFLEMNNYKGYHLSTIQDITIQVLKSLRDMHDNANLIHTDLKPENILLEDDRSFTLDSWKELPLQVFAEKKDARYKIKRDGTIEHFYCKSDDLQLKEQLYSVPYSTKVKVIDFGSATYTNEN
mmetsp:Transcript_13243/g.13193  ORF Transcript_13243/g.13193 Transcript_13243/m.13193 type:complete len:241 (+) Transcript_13243:105-827(+)